MRSRAICPQKTDEDNIDSCQVPLVAVLDTLGSTEIQLNSGPVACGMDMPHSHLLPGFALRYMWP